jgi:hypothetical protein
MNAKVNNDKACHTSTPRWIGFVESAMVLDRRHRPHNPSGKQLWNGQLVPTLRRSNPQDSHLHLYKTLITKLSPPSCYCPHCLHPPVTFPTVSTLLLLPLLSPPSCYFPYCLHPPVTLPTVSTLLLLPLLSPPSSYFPYRLHPPVTFHIGCQRTGTWSVE